MPRAGLWGAQTPQMFQHGLLTRALLQAGGGDGRGLGRGGLGASPRLVESDLTNLKVTP